MRDLGWGRLKLKKSKFGVRGNPTGAGGSGLSVRDEGMEDETECDKLKQELEEKLKKITEEKFILGHNYYHKNVEHIILIDWDSTKSKWEYYWVPRLTELEFEGNINDKYKQIAKKIKDKRLESDSTIDDFDTVIQYLISWFNVRETGIVVKEFNTPNDAFGEDDKGVLDMQDYLNGMGYVHINIDNDDNKYFKSLKSSIQQYFNECIVSKLDEEQIINVFDNFKTDPPEQSIATGVFNAENIIPSRTSLLGSQDPFEINRSVMKYDENTSTFTFNLVDINDPLTNVLLQLFMGDGYHDFAKKSGSRNIKNGKLNYIEQFWLGFIPSNNKFEYRKGENANYITNPKWLNVSADFIGYSCPSSDKTLYYNKDVTTVVADVCRVGICNNTIQVITLANAIDAGSGSLKKICDNVEGRTDNMTVIFNLPPLSDDKVRTITTEYTYTNKSKGIKIIYTIGTGNNEKTYTYQSTNLLGAPGIAKGINAKEASFTPNFIFLKFIGDFGRILYNYQMYKKDNTNYYLYETNDIYSSRLAAIFSPLAYVKIAAEQPVQAKMGGFQATQLQAQQQAQAAVQQQAQELLEAQAQQQAEAEARQQVQELLEAQAQQQAQQQRRQQVRENNEQVNMLTSLAVEQLTDRLKSYASQGNKQGCENFYNAFIYEVKSMCDDVQCGSEQYQFCTKLYNEAQKMWNKYCKRNLLRLRRNDLCPQPPGFTCKANLGGRKRYRDQGFGKLRLK